LAAGARATVEAPAMRRAARAVVVTNFIVANPW
jgi:hypothetical protein